MTKWSMSGASLPFWSESNENSLVVKFFSEIDICRLLVFQYSTVTGTLAYVNTIRTVRRPGMGRYRNI